jgi:hypothetical protein
MFADSLRIGMTMVTVGGESAGSDTVWAPPDGDRA